MTFTNIHNNLSMKGKDMEDKNIFPKEFFTTNRPCITFEESIKSDYPYEWSDEVLSGKKIGILDVVKHD